MYLSDINRLTNHVIQLCEGFGDAVTSNGDESPLVRTPHHIVSHEEDGLVIQVELPGVAEGALDIELEGDMLSVAGRAAHRELEYRREFRMAPELDLASIDATLTDGVLRLFIPKAEEAKPRKISIGIGPSKN